MGYPAPYLVHAFTNPTGRGGSGGGAIELVSGNDLTLGSHAVIDMSAGDGWGGMVGGGGGGSGGTIRVAHIWRIYSCKHEIPTWMK